MSKLRFITYQEAEDLTKLGVEVLYSYADCPTSEAKYRTNRASAFGKTKEWTKDWPLYLLQTAYFFVEEE